MIRIEFTEDESKWIGTVCGYGEGELTPKVKIDFLNQVWERKLVTGKRLEDVIKQGLASANESLKAAPNATAQLPVIMSYSFPKPGKTPAVKTTPAPHGLKPATDQFLTEKYPNAFRHFTASSQSEFELEFLKNVQGLIIDYANNTGRLLNPENYVNKIWTIDLIRTLAKRVNKTPTKAFEMLLVKRWLLTYWEPMKLHELDREELACIVHNFFPFGYKADAIWKMAYRLGLLSSRTPGPKIKTVV